MPGYFNSLRDDIINHLEFSFMLFDALKFSCICLFLLAQTINLISHLLLIVLKL